LWKSVKLLLIITSFTVDVEFIIYFVAFNYINFVTKLRIMNDVKRTLSYFFIIKLKSKIHCISFRYNFKYRYHNYGNNICMLVFRSNI